MSYEHLSDEDKVLEAIKFVARGVTMPHQLKEHLEANQLYELIVNPINIQEAFNVDNQGHTGRHLPRVPREDQPGVSGEQREVLAG